MKSLKRKPDLISHLQRLGFDTEGTVSTLKDRLKEHLRQIADWIQRLDQVQVRPPLLKPSTICTSGEDVLLCSDDERRAIVQSSLSYDGVTIYMYGTATELARYPPDVTRVGSILLFWAIFFGLFLRHTKHFVAREVCIGADWKQERWSHWLFETQSRIRMLRE